MPHDKELPEMMMISRDTLLVQSYEAWAVGDVDEEGRNAEIVTFSGRWNKSEETGTFSVFIEEELLVDIIAGLQRGLQSIQEASGG